MTETLNFSRTFLVKMLIFFIHKTNMISFLPSQICMNHLNTFFILNHPLIITNNSSKFASKTTTQVLIKFKFKKHLTGFLWAGTLNMSRKFIVEMSNYGPLHEHDNPLPFQKFVSITYICDVHWGIQPPSINAPFANIEFRFIEQKR